MNHIKAMKRALVDEDGENRAVRWFLAAYRNPGMSVGGMKAHLKLSGYPLWPDWVERCHPSEHLTKAGAQLWIRHLFSLEATPPAAPVQEPTNYDEYVETACALIKAADDAAADRDYMLDSNDCIAVLRGQWKEPLANDMPQRPAAPVQEPTLQEQLHDALRSLGFYKSRVDALQQWQSKMRDPERTIVCDIIANGCTLEPAGDRYTTPPAAQPATCTWTPSGDHNEPGTWAASCGAMWTFTDGGPVENDVHYCHKCGGALQIEGADDAGA